MTKGARDISRAPLILRVRHGKSRSWRHEKTVPDTRGKTSQISAPGMRRGRTDMAPVLRQGAQRRPDFLSEINRQPLFLPVAIAHRLGAITPP